MAIKTVGTLIKKLSKFPPSTKIFIDKHHVESGNYLDNIFKIELVDTVMEEKQCRDMMDGETYTTTQRVIKYLNKEKSSGKVLRIH